MFKSVLVANRGEIACRVFRTARRMGLRTIAVYSEADAQALHVREADEAVLIGPAAARESYLDAAKVLAAAKATGAEAIHPGYGFLSENADFAEAVAAAGIIWIGPKPSSIRAMGLKDAAKKLMIEAGVPVTPGYQGEDQSLETLTAEAGRIGFPVLIKAVAGGGGKGMRKVDRAEDFAEGLASAQREGQSSFGDPRVLIESYITRPRHIEVQVFGDSHGNVVHLHERDCSLQRRHQKVIEEAPAPGMDQATRDAVTAAAVRAAKAVDYQGAGTIEFIADASDGLKADRIWFMEMNTRLQVEHPVTESITGVDLVEWQLRVAAGQPIPLAQADIPMKGWAMEARLYAEDPANGFLPSIGRLDHFVMPGNRHRYPTPQGVRVDAGVAQRGEVSQFYDPMIAKLIVHEDSREAAAAALAEACGAVEVSPVKTNAGFLVRCLEHPRFVAGDVDTGFIAAEEDDLLRFEISPGALQGAARILRADEGGVVDPSPFSPWGVWSEILGFRANAQPALRQTVFVDGERRSLVIEDTYASHMHTDVSGGALTYFEDGNAFRVSSRAPAAGTGGSASDGGLRAPMPGKIVAAPAKAGDKVAKGQPVVVLEAMKMEHALTAPFDGVVAEFNVAVGDQVVDGAVLAVVKAEAAGE
ncbi:Methylcrotonyl-CoA carboxylase biotin-containing subunit [Brevundimonas diminuta 3F5N]|uniref:Methylcrotonyl-CoA carboxylase biotin-containing subunit n=1 Tax=Brevundimonas diminuta 3F5N TaxID=1255603 RepID=A0A1R4G956_BREDI|nr:biotin carboxylase N-terminal domain-containing protein [Brevundimonas diminuta]SJM64542.1 Methylcrotonyl-CoA carboxylase biotin-containing subunit [Brevundimonas diminuta 3F5N]